MRGERGGRKERIRGSIERGRDHWAMEGDGRTSPDERGQLTEPVKRTSGRVEAEGGLSGVADVWLVERHGAESGQRRDMLGVAEWTEPIEQLATALQGTKSGMLT